MGESSEKHTITLSTNPPEDGTYMNKDEAQLARLGSVTMNYNIAISHIVDAQIQARIRPPPRNLRELGRNILFHELRLRNPMPLRLDHVYRRSSISNYELDNGWRILCNRFPVPSRASGCPANNWRDLLLGVG